MMMMMMMMIMMMTNVYMAPCMDLRRLHAENINSPWLHKFD